MNQQQIVQTIYNALDQALAGNTDEALEHLDRLGTRLDVNGMYGVCCALALAGSKALQRLYGQLPDDAVFAITELVPGGLQREPAEAFASRFLVAYANQDRATALALHETAVRAGREAYTGSVQALLATVAGVIRIATDDAA
ncbi:hypothetical protein AB0H73_09340 [Streptomyces olivoreticuli]